MARIECLGSVAAIESVKKENVERKQRNQWELEMPELHYHECKNGPDNTRPDLHVCEVCGCCFQRDMSFEVPFL